MKTPGLPITKTANALKSAFAAFLQTNIPGLLRNLAILYLLFFASRWVFYWENSGFFNLSWQSFKMTVHGGLLYDTLTIIYVNCLWLGLYLLPLHWKERRWMQKLQKWLFIVVNTFALALNLGDSVLFTFRQHRSTMAMFTEFGGDGNMGAIMLRGAIDHWYLIILTLLFGWILWRFYTPSRPPQRAKKPLIIYYAGQTLTIGLLILLTIFSAHGWHLNKTSRPVSIGYAQRFALDPIDVDLVLTTPCSLILTFDPSRRYPPKFFSEEALTAIYNPEHYPSPDNAGEFHGVLKGKNVVIIVLESFSEELVGIFTRHLDGDDHKSLTPFLDSLIERSVRFEHTFSNGVFSIDAAPALVASTPRMHESFVVSPFALNHVTGLAELLADEGYYSAYFHGAESESLGLQAFVRSAGFGHYFSMEDYEADSRTGGHADHDGTWGIYDEPFLQYFKMKLSETPQPFVAGLFTLTSHYPFDLPASVASDYFLPGREDIEATVAYTDHALKRFFEEAGKEPWFRNTVFVISADHTNFALIKHKGYGTEVGTMKIPIFIYDPSGTLEPGVRPGIMQQMDVTPTLLNLLGYDKPYFAFGNDVLSLPADSTWAMRWHHVPTFISGNYALMMETEGWTCTRMYDYVSDPTFTTNLINTGLPRQQEMERKLKAVLQTIIYRSLGNNVHL